MLLAVIQPFINIETSFYSILHLAVRLVHAGLSCFSCCCYYFIFKSTFTRNLKWTVKFLAINLQSMLMPFHITCKWSYFELQCDSNYKHLFSTINDALTFYKQLDMTKYKNLRQHAVRIARLFGSTYLCEQAFSKMNVNKSSLRSSLTD